MKTKNVPRKNYLILTFLIIFTVLCVFYLRSWYITAKEYYDNNSVVLDAISEINMEEINNYSLDNADFVLYVASGQNKEVKSFEKEFKKFILKNDLRNQVLYLNSAEIDLSDFNSCLNNLTENDIKSELKDINSSAIYIFQKGKIVKVINNPTDINKIEIIFNSYEVIDND